jgi:hypothetical protein
MPWLVERTEKSGAGGVIGISRPFWNMNQLNEALDHAIDKLARSRLGQHKARQMIQRLQKDNQHQGSGSAVCTNNEEFESVYDAEKKEGRLWRE